MRVKHPEPVKTECPVYACTLAAEDHQWPEPSMDSGDELVIWHYDDTTGVHWPIDDEGAGHVQ